MDYKVVAEFKATINELIFKMIDDVGMQWESIMNMPICDFYDFIHWKSEKMNKELKERQKLNGS